MKLLRIFEEESRGRDFLKEQFCELKIVNTVIDVVTYTVQICPFSIRQNRQKATKTTLTVCSMLMTLLQEDMCVLFRAFLPAVWAEDYFNIIKVNTADMSYAESKTTHKNISALSRQKSLKSTNIQPGAKNNILIYKKECNAIATEMTTRRIVQNVLMKTKLSR